MFSPGHLYHPMVYWALIGAVLPVPFYLLAKRWPNSWIRFVNIPVMLTGCAYIPPATGYNYASWCVVLPCAGTMQNRLGVAQVPRRLHLPVPHAPPSLPLVVQVQFCACPRPVSRSELMTSRPQVLSAGLEGGTLLSGVLIFFCLIMPKGGALEPCVAPSSASRSGLIRLAYRTWWGNTCALRDSVPRDFLTCCSQRLDQHGRLQRHLVLHPARGRLRSCHLGRLMRARASFAIRKGKPLACWKARV